MKRAASPNELEPGAFVAGKSWLAWWVRESLWCMVLFGRPDRDDAGEMSRAFGLELDDRVARHDTLVDAGALEGIDPSAFELLQAFARDNLERSRAKVARLALVLPRGVSGAVVAGFYGVLGPPFPISTFESREQALAWLGASEVALEDALAEAQGLPPLLGQLRALLRTRLADAEFAEVANALGLSERTLQRRLAESSTSFVKELLEVRIDEAKRRLIESEDAITVIAIECGFASSQHFSRQFRRAAGVSPSEWRARHRTAPPSAGPS